ncbi:heme biosynthesis protein HemY [Maritimibacter sp. 55A14]|uniref:heme biosynthesis protein HemY n=1 Tax=Maritimibacter sp. 55A14 TaxID=2174844 RepID=UPI000D60EA19|nr:heme biosynthesis HemY N-terminal domain-containing protein [Maritimibacter sp. 55A14]PWE28866.1 heme biosynthesis protein HemY [Maritimibacter sp. 55A14]
MLWSLVKILIFVGLVAALALGAGFLIETGGHIGITAFGREFVLTPLAAVIAFLLLLVLVWLGLKVAGFLFAVLKFINGDETAVSRYFDRNRERKGFEALADGMMALASGEGRLAMSKASKAERYLARPELTNLLTAQAAEMSGDRRKAVETYKKLLGDDRTRFVGVRGLMEQKLAEGDTDTALKLAEKAFALKPGHTETQDTLFRLQADKANWEGARRTLAQKLKSRTLPRDLHTRRDAVLALAEAKADLAEGRTEKATQAVLQANRMSPELVPAAVLAARAKISEGSARAAAKIIRKAWDSEPHPDLAAAFAEIKPDETPQARIKRFQVLLKAKPDHPETRMLAAELAIAAEDFPAARRELGDLPQTDPSQRALTIMAAIERGEGAEDSVVSAWLARALSAPRGPQWTCTRCNHIHAAWAPACENCGSIDTLSWKAPPETETTGTGAAQMLPLIVGALDKPDAPYDPVDEPESDPAEPAGDPAPEPGEDPAEPKAGDAEPEVAEAELVETPDEDTPRKEKAEN